MIVPLLSPFFRQPTANRHCHNPIALCINPTLFPSTTTPTPFPFPSRTNPFLCTYFYFSPPRTNPSLCICSHTLPPQLLLRPFPLQTKATPTSFPSTTTPPHLILSLHPFLHPSSCSCPPRYTFPSTTPPTHLHLKLLVQGPNQSSQSSQSVIYVLLSNQSSQSSQSSQSGVCWDILFSKTECRDRCTRTLGHFVF